MMNAYVDVVALMTSEGKKFPKAIIWSDGKTYRITSFTMTGDKLSLGGKVGTQYIVQIGTNERKLYYDYSAGKWFIDLE